MISPDQTKKCWFALYTKPRHEFKAAEQIERLGVEYYLPVIQRVSQWSDRKKTIAEPLIRGYIFIHADEKERLKSLEEYSILRCVFDKGKPAVIPEWQMENLVNFLKKESEYFIYEGLIPGSRVRINKGPFQGVIGVIRQSENQHTLAVTIELLNRSVLTHISRDIEFEVIKDESGLH
jgi:transcriptional antiterminator RfaH